MLVLVLVLVNVGMCCMLVVLLLEHIDIARITTNSMNKLFPIDTTLYLDRVAFFNPNCPILISITFLEYCNSNGSSPVDLIVVGRSFKRTLSSPKP
jgi:hypothetical protein